MLQHNCLVNVNTYLPEVRINELIDTGGADCRQELKATMFEMISNYKQKLSIFKLTLLTKLKNQ